MSLIETLKALEGPVGVVLGFAGKALLDRRKSNSESTNIDADTAKVFTEIAVALVAPLEARISKLEGENVAAFEYIRALLRWARIEVPDKVPPAPPFHLDL